MVTTAARPAHPLPPLTGATAPHIVLLLERDLAMPDDLDALTAWLATPHLRVTVLVAGHETGLPVAGPALAPLVEFLGAGRTRAAGWSVHLSDLDDLLGHGSGIDLVAVARRTPLAHAVARRLFATAENRGPLGDGAVPALLLL